MVRSGHFIKSSLYQNVSLDVINYDYPLAYNGLESLVSLLVIMHNVLRFTWPGDRLA